MKKIKKKWNTLFLNKDFKFNNLYIPVNVQNFGINKFCYVRTYGCQSNVRDGEAILGILKKLKYAPTNDIKNADFIVLNTCAIRDKAEQKVFGELGFIQQLRYKRPNLILAVCGCMMQQPQVVKKIQNSNWNVDIIFGTNSIHKLPTLIETFMFSSYPVVDVYNDDKLIIENLPAKRSSKVKAFVNVMFGCSNYCTFCIVPYTRGKERSRSLNEIISEIKTLENENYQEVTLLGQNVNNYGLDLEPQLSFKDLLIAVAKTKIPRIRFVTSNPWNFDLSIIPLFKKYSNLMPYFHLPIQSGSNEILAQMNRAMIIEEYISMVQEIRAKIPNCSISTDIIVGFPNETKEQFNRTLELFKICQYDNAYTFIYSKRPNTPAAYWKDNITLTEKKERLQKLNKLVKYYSKKQNNKYLNKSMEVLVESLSKTNKNKYCGYSRNWKLINFISPYNEIGKIIKVKITAIKEFNLEGERYLDE